MTYVLGLGIPVQSLPHGEDARAFALGLDRQELAQAVRGCRGAARLYL